MRHNPILRLFSLVRKIQLPRPSGDRAIGGCRPADFPRFDDFRKVGPVTYESSVAEFSSPLVSDALGRIPGPGISRGGSPTTSRPAALIEPFLTVPPDSSSASMDGESRWLVAPSTSRKAARRLRAVDRAIAEITRDRRPR
jgi:hypothetical protein